MDEIYKYIHVVLVINFGNMMQSVVLDGNPLDEDDGNLPDEVVLNA